MLFVDSRPHDSGSSSSRGEGGGWSLMSGNGLREESGSFSGYIGGCSTRHYVYRGHELVPFFFQPDSSSPHGIRTSHSVILVRRHRYGSWMTGRIYPRNWLHHLRSSLACDWSVLKIRSLESFFWVASPKTLQGMLSVTRGLNGVRGLFQGLKSPARPPMQAMPGIHRLCCTSLPCHQH